MKKDAFIMRFKKGSEYQDKVIQEKEKALKEEFQRSLKSKFWRQLSSISITPIAQTGLGKLYTFEFVAPSFETDAKNKHQQLKNETMSFYGKVRFDYKQFGKDDKILMKEKPLQYCIKMCHIIGWYLQHLHRLDLLKM